MIFEIFPCGPLATNSILIGCEKTKKAALVDPSEGSYEIFQKLLVKYQLKPCAIYLTHSHWDHIVDVCQCKAFWKIPVYVHKLDQENVIHPGSDGVFLLYPVEGVSVDGLLEDGQIAHVGEIEFRVIHTPGHSPGSVVFYFPKEQILLSGDTLFKGSIGNLSLKTAEPEKMWDSLKKLAQLPKATKVYPGHGGSTTLEEERWLDKAEQIFS